MDAEEKEETYLDELTKKLYCMAEGMDPEDYEEDPPEDAQGIAGDLSILELYGGDYVITAIEHLAGRLAWTERKLQAWETGESLTKEEALRAMEEAWKAEAMKDGHGPSMKEARKTYIAIIENPAAGYYDEVKTDAASARVFAEKNGHREAGEVITIKAPGGRLVSIAKWSPRDGKYIYCQV